MAGESENSANIVVNPADKTLEFLKRTNFIEICSDKDKFDQWFSSQTNGQITDHLIRINGLITGKSIKDRGIEQGHMRVGNGLDAAFNSPPLDQKSELLDRSIDGIRQLKDPKRKALLAYVSLQALHLFDDGNGRTGRLLYYLFSNVGNKQAFEPEKIYNLINHQTGERTGDSGREQIAAEIRPVEQIYALYSNAVLKPQVLGNDLEDYNQIYNAMGIGVVEGSLPNMQDQELKKQVNARLSDATGQEGRFGASLSNLAILAVMKRKGAIDEYRFTNPTLEANKIYAYEGGKFFDDMTDDIAQETLIEYDNIRSKFFSGLVATLAATDPDNTALVEKFFQSQ